MKIEVEYIDSNRKLFNHTYKLNRLAFAKHMAIAGQGYSPRPEKLIRTIAMFLQYRNYMQWEEFNNNKFSEPPIQFSDPTEKGQFSTLAGKAIADFLSKRIDQSIITVNYEAGMRLRKLPIFGPRPDLLAFKKDMMFAIESKGRNNNGSGNMTKHKKQSQSGGINVNFTIACVSYNLYSKVKCKYHDPINDNIPYDYILFRDITKNYYRGLSEFLNPRFFEFREFAYGGELFYEVELLNHNFSKIFPDQFPANPKWQNELLNYYRPRLILPRNIKELAQNGLTSSTNFPFIDEFTSQNENLYIDNDRIGLRVRK